MLAGLLIVRKYIITQMVLYAQLHVCEGIRLRPIERDHDVHSLSGMGCRHTSTNSASLIPARV
jgi:hypothetical protein